MVSKVHPATLKRAEKAGIVISGEAEDEHYLIHWAEKNKRLNHADAKAGLEEMLLWKMLTIEYPSMKVSLDKDGTWSIKQGRKALAEGFASLQEAWDAVCATQETRAEAGDNAPTANGDGRSIVKRQYRDAYRGQGHSCGDDLSQQMKTHCLGKDEKVDLAKLKRFAKANGVWDDKYEALNPGQQRMNIGNRLRAKLRKEEGFEVVWK